MGDLSHIDENGRFHMVDVGDKDKSQRTAVAIGRIYMQPGTLELAREGTTKKGNPISIAEIAGIMGAKQTSTLIPLCHPLPLNKVSISIEPQETEYLAVRAVVSTSARTGVEMEALVAVSTACLTLYDMLKAVDKSMRISGIELLEKTGGKSGDYRKAD